MATHSLYVEIKILLLRDLSEASPAVRESSEMFWSTRLVLCYENINRIRSTRKEKNDS
jgi:hypothetical protein